MKFTPNKTTRTLIKMNELRKELTNDIIEYMDLLDEYVKLDRELNYNTDHKIICESCGEVVK